MQKQLKKLPHKSIRISLKTIYINKLCCISLNQQLLGYRLENTAAFIPMEIDYFGNF